MRGTCSRTACTTLRACDLGWSDGSASQQRQVILRYARSFRSQPLTTPRHAPSLPPQKPSSGSRASPTTPMLSASRCAYFSRTTARLKNDPQSHSRHAALRSLHARHRDQDDGRCVLQCRLLREGGVPALRRMLETLWHREVHGEVVLHVPRQRGGMRHQRLCQRPERRDVLAMLDGGPPDGQARTATNNCRLSVRETVRGK